MTDKELPDNVLSAQDYANLFFDEFVQRVSEEGFTAARIAADKALEELQASMPPKAVQQRVSLITTKLDNFYRERPDVAQKALEELVEFEASAV